jgi:drug/metabolite transporter (DMT)-like permease
MRCYEKMGFGDILGELMMAGIFLLGLFGVLFIFGAGTDFGSGQFTTGLMMIVGAGFLMIARAIIIKRT